jgi:hypothetical protein
MKKEAINHKIDHLAYRLYQSEGDVDYVKEILREAITFWYILAIDRTEKEKQEKDIFGRLGNAFRPE